MHDATAILVDGWLIVTNYWTRVAGKINILYLADANYIQMRYIGPDLI